MKLSKTSEYAIRILSYMAKDSDKLYSAKLLVEKLNVSDKYLRKLMTLLSKAGFIKSMQGRYGGYKFAKDIKNIYISNIIDAIEGSEKYLGCILGLDDCSDENPCSMHEVWVTTRAKLISTFEKTSLYKISQTEIIKF